MTTLPLILAGPIVRRADADGVWFWFACRDEITSCTPRITVYDSHGTVNDTLAPDNGFMRMKPPELRVTRLGEHLWIALVKAKPARELTREWIYGYDLTIQSGQASTRLTGMNLAYPPFALPTFMLNGVFPRLAQGSCRRPGAPGTDAYAPFDAWLRRPERVGGITSAPIADSSRRPAALILTGDQIYADDVAPSLFRAAQRLAADVFGYDEHLPNWSGAGTVPAGRITDRKRLTAEPSSPIGFTTDDGDRHLLSFPEFAAMYLLVLNPQLCTDYGVDDHSEALRGYPDAVGACRRVLANLPTYMLCDDHEITDDWNMDEPWVRGTSNPTARRVIANGLAAYWAFQAWGNDPERFDALRRPITAHLDAVRTAHGEPGAAGGAYDRDLLAQHWSFVTPTSPPALCVDTRTAREFPPGKTAVLSGPRVWPDLTALAQRHHLGRGEQLLLVLPTPLLDHRVQTRGQAHYDKPSQRYEYDYELYINNPAQRGDLIRYLRQQFAPSSVVIFSGDVHIGYVSDGLYAGGTRHDLEAGHAAWTLPVIQVTASPIKNESVLKRQIMASAGEEIVTLTERLFDAGDGSTVGGIRREPLGMTAAPVHLPGPLSLSTLIMRNEICVVDLRSDRVEALFVGGTATDISTATANVRIAADVRRFAPAPVFAPVRMHALGPYMQTAIEDAMPQEGAVAVAVRPAEAVMLADPIEGYVYDATGTACATGPRPGATALLHELQAQFHGHSDGIFNCRPVRGGTRLSLHGEGRAVDWVLSAANSTDAAEAQKIIDWLLSTDADGNPDALARRMGVQEIIWNHRIWTSRRHGEGFRPYTGVNPHTDHLHIGLSNAGADMHTSHWRTQSAAPAAPSAQALTLPASQLHWDGATPEQLDFMHRVYDAHVTRSARSRTFVDDVPAAELGPVEGGVRARTETAAACRDLLAAARAALTAAKDHHDQRAGSVERISIVSGYRSASQQLHGWQAAFPTYYRETASQRQAAPGGEHGEQAAELMVRYISARLGAPGFSLHNAGQAVDLGTREAGHDLGATTNRDNITRWRASWLFEWLGAHAQAFGFRQNTHIDEPWHWEFHGRPPGGAPAGQQGIGVGFSAIAARDRLAINDLPLLRDHHDVNPDLVLRWNAMPQVPQQIDVVVHLHGFSSDRHLNLLARKLPLSGLDFAPPATPPDGAHPLPAFTGRTRPTLCVLPRGKCADQPNKQGIWPYRFPAITRAAGFQSLLNEAISRFSSEIGAAAPIPIGRLILTAHSGGGAPLNQILAFTESLHLDPHEVHVFDAFYGPTDNVERWLARRLGADARRLAAGVPDPLAYLRNDGGALRVFYIDGAGTQDGSRRVDQAAAQLIPSGTAYSSSLRDRYAAQRTTIAHSHIPYWYGGRLLADAGQAIASH
jgi:hypothetical protein